MPELNNDPTQDPNADGQDSHQDPNAEGQQNTITFKGKNGTYDVPEDLYNDMVTRFSGEKHAQRTKYEKSIQEILEKNTELETQFNEFKKSKMTEQERMEAEQAEKEQKLMELSERATENQKKYENAVIDAEINRVVTKYAEKLVSPSHMSTLIKYTLNPMVDNGVIKVGDKSLEDAFSDYISLEENKALIRNNMNPGAGTNVGSSNKGSSGQEEWDPNSLKGKSQAEITEYFKKFGYE